MAENMRDTPVTREQHEEYLRDPTSEKGRPYSSRQVASAQHAANQVWLSHREHGRRIFNRADVPDALADGWSEKPFRHPNDPKYRHPEDAKPAESEVEKVSEDLQFLRDQAEKLGIQVDTRWREKRLLAEIEAASSGKGKNRKVA